MTDQQLTDEQAAAAQKAANAVEAVLAGWPVCEVANVSVRDDERIIVGCGERFEPFTFTVIDVTPTSSWNRVVKSILCPDCTYKYFKFCYEDQRD